MSSQPACAVMIPCTVISGGLLFLMFAATNLGGTIAFGILYGFFSGGCASRSLLCSWKSIDFVSAVISLITPAAASFSRDLNEIGQVLLPLLWDLSPDRSVMHSTRIGITSFVIAFALLTGNPIAGALVQVNGSYIWYRPLVFASVSFHCRSALLKPLKIHYPFKVVVLAGAACLTAARSILSERKNTNRLW